MQRNKRHSELLKAYENAQKIAFAPFIFQATVAARDCGILSLLGQAEQAMSIEEMAEKTQVSAYGVQVLVELWNRAEE